MYTDIIITDKHANPLLVVCFSQSIPSSPEPISLLTEDVSTNSNGPKPAEVVLEDDTEDLFAGNCNYLCFFLIIGNYSVYPVRKYSIKQN